MLVRHLESDYRSQTFSGALQYLGLTLQLLKGTELCFDIPTQRLDQFTVFISHLFSTISLMKIPHVRHGHRRLKT